MGFKEADSVKKREFAWAEEAGEAPRPAPKKLLGRSAWFLLLVVVPVSYGIYNIVEPEKYPIKFFRGEVVKVSDAILVGPYPTEKEIRRLKNLGVKEFISLLDPSMPFEASLIEQEKRAVEKQGLAFRSVPLAYLPNLRSPENLDRVAELVEYSRGSTDKKYIHCYLGRHRTTLFKEHYHSMEAPLTSGP